MLKQISSKGQRLLSVLLAVMMIVSVMPMNVFAATNSDGYIEVRTIEDLYNVRNDLTANYILMNDIDLSEATSYGGTWDYGGRGWNPIGSGDVYGGNAFSGIFDGNGYSITGMRINVNTVPDGAGDYVYVGLFANVSGTVKNLTVAGNITSDKASYAGSIAGYGSGKFTNCKSNANISVSAYNRTAHAGGIVGCTNKATIKSCINTGEVYAKANKDGSSYSSATAYIGGIAGYANSAETNVSNSYNIGTIRAEGNSASSSGYQGYGRAAGIVYGTATVEKCYNAGSISATYTGTSSYKSGYANGIGGSVVIESYNVGTVSGVNSKYAITNGTLSNCYYLNGKGSGSTGATSLTEAQMLLSSLFVGFDFNDTWIQNSSAEYPYPQLKSHPQDLRVIESVTLLSEPDKTEYEYGEDLDVTGAMLKITVTNGDDEEIEVTEDMVSGYDAETPGTQTITITYKGRTLTFDVIVNEKYYSPIFTVEDLYNIRKDLTGSYILMNDIDLTAATAEGGAWDFNGNGWNPIGSGDIYSNSAFSGELNGNGHKIIGMRIDVSSVPSGTSEAAYYGLFANVTGYVHDLIFYKGSIKSSVSTSSLNKYVGALAGSVRNATISNVKSEMDEIHIVSNYSTDNYCGGIAGYNYKSNINLCSNYTPIYSEIVGSSGDSSYAGGISGYITYSGNVSECYNVAEIISVGNISQYSSYSASSYAGGISAYNSSSTISKCYNTGEISATKGNYRYASGISNYGTISQCYNVGKITGSYTKDAVGGSTTTNSYYLADSGEGNTGATSLTEAQMLLSSMYSGFDFGTVWTQDADAVYPYPQLKDIPQDLRVIESIEIISLPSKTTYAYGEEFDISGCKINLNIESGDEQVTVTKDMVSGYNSTSPGTQTLTISYLGKTVSFNVIVNEKVYVPIYTIEDLYNVRNNLSGSYILMNDIDMTEATAEGGDWDFNGNGWNPIGSNDVYGSQAFTGEFDGSGHKIIGMRIDVTNVPSGTSTVHLGLFANVLGTVKDLTLTGGSINYKYGNSYYIGSIAARCGGPTGGSAVIENCINNMNINGIATKTNINGYVGGIVGSVYNQYVNIINCANTGNVISHCATLTSSDCDNDYNYAGGIVGDGVTSFVISKCYNIGDVSARATSSAQNYYGLATAAGICESGTIVDCYNAGSVEAIKFSSYGRTEAYGIGGTASCCYNVGTVTGTTCYYATSANCENCYYLDGKGSSSTGATALTATQMKLKTMFAGFDFTNTWTLNEFANHPYPQLINNIQDLDESASIVSIISWPTKTEYMTGDELVLDGCAIDVTYVSGHKELLNVTADIISGYDNTKTGEQIITVTYRGGSDTFPVTVTARPEVTAIELISEPIENQFRVGTEFDFTGAQIKVSYSDDTTEIIDVTIDMTTGGNINHLGNQTITVSYYGKTATFDVTVTAVAISRLRLDAAPDKLTYLEGQELDMTGMVLVAVMNNNTEKQVSVGYTVTGYSDEPGTHTVTVEYMGKKVTFDVTVEARTVVELVLKSAPNKTEYVAGQFFDPEGMMIVATYDNGDIEVVEDYEISGFDNVPGLKTIVATYGDKYVAFPVSIIARVMTDFQITSYPAKLDYLQYDAFDATGLEVEATYNDGVTEKVTDYEMVGYSSNPGTHTISIAYKGWVETFTVNVTARTLTNLIVETPDKLTYYLGEEFDATGLKVTACYNNGQQVVIDDYTVTGFDSNTPGTKTIAIGYGGFTSAFSISVSERSVVETDGNFTVGHLVGRLGDTVAIPISVSKNPGLAGFTHTITFDATDLEFISASAVSSYAEGQFVVNDEKIADGEVTILWVGPTDIVNDGDVYNLTFEILEEATDGISDITISYDDNDNGNVSGENVIFGKVNGYVDIRSYWLGDLDGDRRYAMVDLLQLAQYVSGKQMNLTDKQKLSADVNEDSEIDIHDVIMLQQWLLSADMYSMSTFSLFSLNDEATTEIQFGDVSAKIGDEVTIPVIIKNNPGLATYRFRVTYDTEALEFISAENGSLATSGTISSTTNSEAGTMTFLWYSTTNITGDGELALLNFRVTDSARGDYPLTVTYLPEDMLNEDYDTIPYSVINGNISTGSTSSGKIRSFGLSTSPVTVKLLENGTEIDSVTTADGK